MADDDRWIRVISGQHPDGRRSCAQYPHEDEADAIAAYAEAYPGFEVVRREHYPSKGGR